MASAWTDESAIQRDLSVAQGRWVPGGIETTIAGGKPPTLNITEETEEEYFRLWTSDGDFSTGPDLFRIKKMLELMQDQEAPDEDIPTGPIEITKSNRRAGPASLPQLNPKAVKFIPKSKAHTKETKDPTPNKPRRARNVAIASIMALTNQIEVQEPLKLCKPEDFMKSVEDDEINKAERRKDSVNKVTNWLQSQDITPMFKNKSSVHSSNNEQSSNLLEFGAVTFVKKSPVKSKLDDSVNSKSESSVRSPHNEQYVPSSWADEYYKKAVDRSHMRDLVRNDVWRRAEKVMKEIDEHKAEELRKQQETALAAAQDDHIPDHTTEEDLHQDNSEGIAHVVLSKHRHELFPGHCVVCEVLTVLPGPAETEPGFAETPPNLNSEPTKSQPGVTPNFTRLGDKVQPKSVPEPSSIDIDTQVKLITEPSFSETQSTLITEPSFMETPPIFTRPNLNRTTTIQQESTTEPSFKAEFKSVTKLNAIGLQVKMYEDLLKCFHDEETCTLNLLERNPRL